MPIGVLSSYDLSQKMNGWVQISNINMQHL